jgi:dTDP-6-deoxy-L-talose 4-dehydrogenase (NAD+)
MKIALTGGTGFIGQHVRKLLAKSEHDVLLVVRDQAKIGELGANEEFVTAEIREDRSDWFDYLGRPDVLLHLAWGGLPNYLDSYHFDVELPSQVKFLNNLIIGGLCQLVVTGTCYEYGISDGEQYETQQNTPCTPYGIAKNDLRKFLVGLQKTKNYELSWARVFYPYGEGQSKFSLFSELKSAALRGEKEFELKNATSNLDFISVHEVAKVLVKLIEHKSGSGVVNVGSGVPTDVASFARSQIAGNDWGIDLKLISTQARHYESSSFWASTKKLREFLDES